MVNPNAAVNSIQLEGESLVKAANLLALQAEFLRRARDVQAQFEQRIKELNDEIRIRALELWSEMVESVVLDDGGTPDQDTWELDTTYLEKHNVAFLINRNRPQEQPMLRLVDDDSSKTIVTNPNE